MTRQSSINYVSKKTILLIFVNRHWSKHLIDRHVTFYSFFDFVISFCSIVRQEKAKNKNITRNKNDEYMSKVEICWCKKCRLFDSFHHLFSDFQSEFHLIVNDLHRMFVENSNSFDLQSRQIKSLFSHFFDTCNLNYVFNFEISHKFALRHVSMRRFYLFSKRSNSRFSDLHMLAKIFRVNSRSRFIFLFAFFDFRKFFIQFQFANVVKNISSFICLAIDSHRSFRKSKTMKYSWKFLFWESIDLKKSQKLFVFEFRNSRSCLFVVSTFFARFITHLEKTSWFEKV